MGILDNVQQKDISNKEGFFSVALSTIDRMASEGASAENVMGYLVLARHAQGKGARMGWTSAGANAIAKKIGTSYRKAQSTLEWLSGANNSAEKFITPATEITDAPSHFGKSETPSQQTKIKYYLEPSSELSLPNSLIEGIGKGTEDPPLSRINKYIKPNLDAGIAKHQARLDTVMVLMHLYKHHDIEGCSGVDPTAGIYREWNLADNSDMEATGSHINEAREPITNIEGTNIALYEVSGGNQFMYTLFAKEALHYVKNEEERNKRFWCAFSNLRPSFVYEVLTIWDSNPLQDKGAEVQYPLYIFDSHARQNNEPYLQEEVHKTAIHFGVIDGFDFSKARYDSEDECRILNSDRFRYIAHQKTDAYPLGVFRLRFKPKDRDTALGMAKEKNRTEEWSTTLAELRE